MAITVTVVCVTSLIIRYLAFAKAKSLKENRNKIHGKINLIAVNSL